MKYTTRVLTSGAYEKWSKGPRRTRLCSSNTFDSAALERRLVRTEVDVRTCAHDERVLVLIGVAIWGKEDRTTKITVNRLRCCKEHINYIPIFLIKRLFFFGISLAPKRMSIQEWNRSKRISLKRGHLSNKDIFSFPKNSSACSLTP